MNELLNRELADAGYAGVEIRNAPMRTEIIIKASKPNDVLGDKGRRIRELTLVLQKRFKYAEGAVELYAERVANKGLSAQAQVRPLFVVLDIASSLLISPCPPPDQAESLKFKLVGGLAVRRAAYGVIKCVLLPLKLYHNTLHHAYSYSSFPQVRHGERRQGR